MRSFDSKAAARAGTLRRRCHVRAPASSLVVVAPRRGRRRRVSVPVPRCTARTAARWRRSTRSASRLRGDLHRDHGPLRFGEDDAPAVGLRPRSTDERLGAESAGSRSADMNERELARSFGGAASGSCSRTSACCRRSTAEQNVALPLRLDGRRVKGCRARRARPRRARRSARHRPAQLSGGQQQRVAIARALVSRARGPVRRRADGRARSPQHGEVLELLRAVGRPTGVRRSSW